MLDFTMHPLNIAINQVSIGNKKLTNQFLTKLNARTALTKRLILWEKP